MRLIDADLVLKRLEEWNTSDKMDKALYNFARNRIVEQPTAYNIDKVVEQLEDYLFEKYCVEGDSEIERIVKGGGVDAKTDS